MTTENINTNTGGEADDGEAAFVADMMQQFGGGGGEDVENVESDIESVEARTRAQEEARTDSYWNPEDDAHEDAVYARTTQRNIKAEAERANDVNDHYRAFTLDGVPGVDVEDRHALVGAARADNVAVEDLTKLVSGFKDAGRVTWDSLKQLWGSEIAAKYDAAERWLREHPSLREIVIAAQQGKSEAVRMTRSAQFAFAIDAMLQQHGNVDDALATLMAPGSPYWQSEHPQNAQYVEKVTRLHAKRFGSKPVA